MASVEVPVTPPEGVGLALAAARDKAGLSLIEASFQLRSHLPKSKSYWVSHEKIRRIERGDLTDDEIDPVLIAALARVYGVEPVEISADLPRRVAEAVVGALGIGEFTISDLDGKSKVEWRPQGGEPCVWEFRWSSTSTLLSEGEHQLEFDLGAAPLTFFERSLSVVA